jgi:predicted DNA-binding protein
MGIMRPVTKIHLHVNDRQLNQLKALTASTGNDRAEEIRRAIDHHTDNFSDAIKRGFKIIDQRSRKATK